MEFILYSLIFIITLAFLKNYFNGPFTKLRKRMGGKIIIVTGSNSGVGKKAAIQLLEDGADVIFACSDKQEIRQLFKKFPEELKMNAHFLRLDLCSFVIIDKFVKKFSKKFNKLDMLINTAEKFPEDFKLTVDGIESIFQSNHLGQMYLTTQLLKYFNKDEGRIINVSNIFHNFSDISEKQINKAYYDTYFEKTKELYNNGIKSRFIHYSNTKKANLFLTSYLAEQLEPGNHINIKTCSVMPGIVCQNVSKYYIDSYWYVAFVVLMLSPLVHVFAKTSKAGAQTLLHVCYMNFEEIVNGGNYTDCKLNNITKMGKELELRNLFINYSLYVINVIGTREINMTVKKND